MLLILKSPRGMGSLSHLIENEFSRICKTNKIPFKEFMSGEHAALYLRLKPEQLIPYLRKSKLVHGISIMQEIYVHPEGVVKSVNMWMRKHITRDNKRIKNYFSKFDA